MAKFPPDDPVNALVPHTLKEPMAGSGKGPLAGRSFMVKDLFAIKGHKVSIGNPEWYAAASPAAETAPALLRLLDAGATLTGITICDELLYSVLGTNVHYGAPVNIHALRHVTGGSSCGSAAAVAAAMCDFALGSDTGGSIRVPAAFCGLYGLRPTHGRIDMSGVTPMAPSYDTVGFLARDAALFRDIGRALLEGIERRRAASACDPRARHVCARRGEHRRGDLARARQDRERLAEAGADGRGRRGVRHLAERLPLQPGLSSCNRR